MRVLLCIIGGIALILAALCVPLRFSLTGAVESGGGRGCVAARYLFFCKRLFFDLYLLDPPQLTLVWHNGAERLSSHPLLGKKKKKRKSPTGHALMHALHLGEMRLTWVVGIRDDPAAAALCCELLEHVSRIAWHAALSEKLAVDPQIAVLPRFDTDLLRLEVLGIGKVFPAQIILELLQKREKTDYGASD